MYDLVNKPINQYATFLLTTRMTGVAQSVILLGGSGLMAKNGENEFSIYSATFSLLIGSYLIMLHKNYRNHRNHMIELAIKYESNMNIPAGLSIWKNYKENGRKIRDSFWGRLLHHQAPFYLMIFCAALIIVYNILHIIKQ